MIEINIPGRGLVHLDNLVCDYNGTLAQDGKLLPGVGDALLSLAASLRVHVITADTFGQVARELHGLPVTLEIIPAQSQAQAKLDYITRLGVETVVAVGNGLNDSMMLHEAAIGIALVQKEGASAVALASADIVLFNILDALDLLLNPKRLVATLRS